MSSVRYEMPSSEGDAAAAHNTLQPSATDNTLSDAWSTIRKRRWIILGFALLGLLYGLYKGDKQPRLYEATGTIEIRSGSANEYRITPGAASTDIGRGPTQIAILKSDVLLLAVARDLNLANDPDFMGTAAGTGFRNIDDPPVRQAVLAGMQGIVSVAAVPKTDILRITCSTLNPKLSAAVVNKLVREYIQYSLESRAEASKRVSDFFRDQLDDLKQRVETSQTQMIDLQKKLGVLGFDPSLNQVTTALGDLNRATNAAEVARIQAETRYRVLNGMPKSSLDDSLATSQPAPAAATGSQSGVATGTTPSDTFAAAATPSGVSSGAVASLRSQLESARAAQALSSANLGPNHPQSIALRDQIAQLERELGEEQQRVLTDARQAFLVARAQEDQTRATLNTQKDDAFRLRDDLIEYTIRQREFESNRTLYEGLIQRLNTARVEAGLESTEIDILDVAVPPIAPSLRPRSNIAIVNMLVMLVAGLIVAFVLDSLDTGLRSVAEVEAVSGVPSLALIPRAKRTPGETAAASVAQRALGVLANPKSQFAEAFRALRTSLLLSVAGGEPRTILLTSATPAEGKTTVSINLACVLAQRNVRVLLIDADLRRPTVHHRFGLNGKVGLTSVLTGAVAFKDAVQTVAQIPTLDILVAGPVPPFPTEMLSSETMSRLLDDCRETYTHIVMDSPPLLSVTDSVVLARDADAVVLVVRHGKSSKPGLRRARDLLVRSGARITGIAINAVDLNSPEYYSYYGYYGYTGYASPGMDANAWDPATTAADREDDPQSKSNRTSPPKGDRA